MAGRNGNSKYFEVKGNAKKPYTITINYDTGHFCSCRGMISKKSTYGADTGRTGGTSCKHINDIINTKFGGDWGKSTGQGKPRIRATIPAASTPTTPSEPTGRRAAIMAQRARREQKERVTSPSSGLSLIDRIAALESAREGALS